MPQLKDLPMGFFVHTYKEGVVDLYHSSGHKEMLRPLNGSTERECTWCKIFTQDYGSGDSVLPSSLENCYHIPFDRVQQLAQEIIDEQTSVYVVPDSTIAALNESIAICDRMAKEASDGEE